MKHSRRVSPRISYDEAVCLTRVDGRGRLFGRSVDLAPAGIYVTSAELCEIGTELVCSVLLPGGPRHLRGRVVRLVALPRAVGIAVQFTELAASDRLAIEQLIASRRPEAQPAKLSVGGLEHPLRCEAFVGAGERTVRVSTALPPFLRLDADIGLDLSLGVEGEARPRPSKRGVIRRIAVDPAPRDGVPRLALDVDLEASGPNGAAALDERAPPSALPRPYRHPLPSVLLSQTLAFQIVSDPSSAAPPRRRSRHTAEISRRFSDARVRAVADELTQPIARASGARAAALAWLTLGAMLVTATLALVARFAIVGFAR
jgi:hypothetical protein